MVGAITSGQISEYIGRKGSLMIAAIPNIIGWLAISFARVPVYIPQNMRGAMGFVNQESCYHIFWHYLLNGGCLQFLELGNSFSNSYPELMVLSSVPTIYLNLQSIQISFALIPLLCLVSKEEVMGYFKIGTLLQTASWLVAALVNLINGYLMVDFFSSEWGGSKLSTSLHISVTFAPCLTPSPQQLSQVITLQV